jgi:hypothetical protein
VLNACFLVVSANTEVHPPPEFRNILDMIIASAISRLYTNAFLLINPVSEAIHRFVRRREQTCIQGIAIKPLIHIIAIILLPLLQ